MFYKIKEPKQYLLDGLYNEELLNSGNNCHDCGVEPAQNHLTGCDIARCKNTGEQRLQCDCENCGDDEWTGLWPGVKYAYENKLICFDTATKKIVFDLNEVAIHKSNYSGSCDG